VSLRITGYFFFIMDTSVPTVSLKESDQASHSTSPDYSRRR
jgi:hypothetical protein